jgi:hypothetical protein
MGKLENSPPRGGLGSVGLVDGQVGKLAPTGSLVDGQVGKLAPTGSLVHGQVEKLAPTGSLVYGHVGNSHLNQASRIVSRITSSAVVRPS